MLEKKINKMFEETGRLQTDSTRAGKVSLCVCLMVFNATFNNISDISWWSVLLVEKTTDLSQVILTISIT